MSDLTNYTEGIFRDWMSQSTDAPTAPTDLHVALHTADPGESPDGTTELSGGDYNRVSVSTGAGFNTPNHNSFENADTISFPQASADWGEVTYVSLWDSSTGGNCFAAFSLDTSVTINTNDTLEFGQGQLTFNFE